MNDREYLDGEGLKFLVKKIVKYVEDTFQQQDAMQYQGTYTLQTASGSVTSGNFTGTSPIGNQYAKGWTYKIVANGTTTKGYFGNVKVETGDMVIVNSNESITTEQKFYDIIQTNLDGVITKDPSKAMTTGNLVSWLSDGVATDSGISATAVSGVITTVNGLINGLLSDFMSNKVVVNKLMYFDGTKIVSSPHSITDTQITAGTSSAPADIVAYGGIAAYGIVDPNAVGGVTKLSQLTDVVGVESAKNGYILAYNKTTGNWECVANNPASISESQQVEVIDGETVKVWATTWTAGTTSVKFIPVPKEKIEYWFKYPNTLD